MQGFLLFIIFAVGITVLVSIGRIYAICHQCYVSGSTKGFFSNVWEVSCGNIFMVIWFPVYYILRLLINMKNKSFGSKSPKSLMGKRQYDDSVKEYNRFLCNLMGCERAI